MEKGVCERAKKVKLLALDVDGVLTDGRLFIGAAGEVAKGFHAQDGLGVALALRAGIVVALITGRTSEIVARRATELGITEVHQGIKDKQGALGHLLTRYDLSWEDAAYVGDDLNDLAVMKSVGMACAVANAVAEVRQTACWITSLDGGQGAVREIIEGILKVQGRWEEMVASCLEPQQGAVAQ